jgi:hypothetical protein
MVHNNKHDSDPRSIGDLVAGFEMPCVFMQNLRCHFRIDARNLWRIQMRIRDQTNARLLDQGYMDAESLDSCVVAICGARRIATRFQDTKIWGPNVGLRVRRHMNKTPRTSAVSARGHAGEQRLCSTCQRRK